MEATQNIATPNGMNYYNSVGADGSFNKTNQAKVLIAFGRENSNAFRVREPTN